MSLTQNDLGHGFLFRHKDDPEVIGRLSLGEYDYKNHIEFVEKGEWDEIKFNPLKWEGIPITPELLRDWYGIKKSAQFSISGGSMICIEVYKSIISVDIRIDGDEFKSIEIETPTHIHDLQRLVLALTGKPLEGGPK